MIPAPPFSLVELFKAAFFIAPKRLLSALHWHKNFATVIHGLHGGVLEMFMSGHFTAEPSVRTPARFTGEAAASYLLGALPAGSNQKREALHVFNRVHLDFPNHEPALLRAEFLQAVRVLTSEGVIFSCGSELTHMVLWRR